MCGRYRLSRRKQIIEEYFDSGSGVVRVRRAGESLERPERTVGQVLFDPDYDSERRDLAVHDRRPVILDSAAYGLSFAPGVHECG